MISEDIYLQVMESNSILSPNFVNFNKNYIVLLLIVILYDVHCEPVYINNLTLLRNNQKRLSHILETISNEKASLHCVLFCFGESYKMVCVYK